MATLKSILTNILSEKLKPLGFKKKKESFIIFTRTMDDCEQMFVVPTRSRSGYLIFEFDLWIKFASIERLCDPQNLNKNELTVGCSINGIAARKKMFDKYIEWGGRNEEELIIAVDLMLEVFREHGMPIFTKYSTIKALEEELEKPNEEQIFSLNITPKYGTRAAIAMLLNDRAKAERILQDASKDRYNELHKEKYMEQYLILKKNLLGE